MSKETSAQIISTSGFFIVGENPDQITCSFDLIDDNYMITEIKGPLCTVEVAEIYAALVELQRVYDENK